MSQFAAGLTIRPATAAERLPAARLAFAELPADQRETQALPWQPDSGTHPVWIAARAGQMVAALPCQALAGKTWLVHPPRWLPSESSDTAAALLNVSLEAARQQGICLAQALLPSETSSDADVLRAAGFHHATDLYYLGCDAVQFPRQPPETPLTFQPYDPANRQRLEQVMEATYQGTMDCAALNGVRQTADVLASYREVGAFDPARWLIVGHQGADVGCLLLAEHPASRRWELVYMGLIPAARGQGWGVQVARHAQWLTRFAGCNTLLLAVDAANAPALKMYAAAGFEIWDQRSVFLRVLNVAV